nr:immunoglobulin heavy chain junction region [Macaca mulatta]
CARQGIAAGWGLDSW